MNGYIEKPAIYPSLMGRNVFITGGGSGIGENLVEHFCQQGAQVCFADIAEDSSRDLVARLRNKVPVFPHYFHCDLRNIEALRLAVAEACERFAKLCALETVKS